MNAALGAWLSAGSAAVADWGGHVRRLAARGALGAARGLLLDLPALAQPHACRSGTCAPGLREPRRRSCCADLDVELTEGEAARITEALPRVAAWMSSRDSRWASGVQEPFEGTTLRRPGRRCIFAASGPEGLTCALHAVEDEGGRSRGSLKPMPCRLFPLVVVDLGDGHVLLTALARHTSTLVGGGAAAFPCLRGGAGPTLAESAADTLEELWSGPVARAIVGAAQRYGRGSAQIALTRRRTSSGSASSPP